MKVFKSVKVVLRSWNATDVYLVTGLIIGFAVWLVMGVFLINSALKVVGL